MTNCKNHANIPSKRFVERKTKSSFDKFEIQTIRIEIFIQDKTAESSLKFVSVHVSDIYFTFSLCSGTCTTTYAHGKIKSIKIFNKIAKISEDTQTHTHNDFGSIYFIHYFKFLLF